jgi:hypothetical protein
MNVNPDVAGYDLPSPGIDDADSLACSINTKRRITDMKRKAKKEKWAEHG